MTLIDVTFNAPLYGQQHVVVDSPFGGGGGYQVLINNYFRGQIVRHANGWKSFVKSEVLMQDDIDAIIEAIEKINDRE